MALVDADARVLWVNQGMADLGGYARPAFSGHVLTECLTGPDTDPETLASISDHIRRGEPFEVDLCRYRGDGAKYYARITGQSVGTEAEVGCYVWTEQEVDRQEDPVLPRPDVLLDAMPLAVLAVRPSGDVVMANEAAENLLGYAPGQLIQTTLDALVPDEWRARLHHHRDLYVARPRPFDFGTVPEVHAQRADGTLVALDLGINALVSGGELLILIMAGRVGEQRSQTSWLRKKYAQLELAVEGSRAGLWELSIPTRTLTSDRRWREILNVGSDTTDLTLDGLDSLVHPEDIDGVRRSQQLHFEGHCPMYEAEYRVRSPEGWDWVLDRGRVVTTDERGQPRRAMGITLDIATRKRAEADRERAHRRAEASVQPCADLLAAVNHKVYAPLTSIRGFAECIAADAPDEIQPLADIICDSTDELLASVDTLLTLARLESGSHPSGQHTFNAARTVTHTVRAWESRVEEKGCTIKATLADADVPVTQNRDALQRVLDALLSTVLASIRPGGHIDVTCDLDGEHLLRIRVADSDSREEGSEEPAFPGPCLQIGLGQDGVLLEIACAARLAEHMGGTLTRSGQGYLNAALTLRIPIGAAEAAAPKPAQSDASGTDTETPT